MLEEADASVAAWLAPGLPPGAHIAFGRPDPGEQPAINLFLHRVQAEESGLRAGPVRLRDGDGKLTGTRLPVRYYRLSYLVTAWAADCHAEHQLLGAVLARHARSPVLPAECLRGSMTAFAEPLALTMASEAPPAGIWAELGLTFRSSVVLSLTVPVTPPAAPAETPRVTGVELRSGPS